MPKNRVITNDEEQKAKITNVKADMTALELSKAGCGIHLIIDYDGSKLGEIVIGRGSLNWKPGNKHTSKRVTWKDFAARVEAGKPIF
jgi:hypothetical protein